MQCRPIWSAIKVPSQLHEVTASTVSSTCPHYRARARTKRRYSVPRPLESRPRRTAVAVLVSGLCAGMPVGAAAYCRSIATGSAASGTSIALAPAMVLPPESESARQVAVLRVSAGCPHAGCVARRRPAWQASEPAPWPGHWQSAAGQGYLLAARQPRCWHRDSDTVRLISIWYCIANGSCFP